MDDFPKIDKKQMLDPEVFKKALKIMISKPKKPKEEFWSRKALRYETAINTYDVLGCAKVINELKIYFDETLDNKKEKKKDGYISNEALFLKSLRNLAQLLSYHNGKKEHWKSAESILNKINIPISIFNFEMHGHIFSEWDKN